MAEVLFLHIPKTAGQSVHQFLVDTFGADNICPLRVNAQINQSNEGLLGASEVVSGHIDWSKSLEYGYPKFTFTVLRDPKDRIISFYFYLRSQAKALDEDQLCLPQHAGMRAALTLTPNEYFCSQDGELREFIDDHYDNFYTYYFAYKKYTSRREQKLKGRLNQSKEHLTLAFRNLFSLNAVYTLDNWTLLKDDLVAYFPDKNISSREYFMNRGDSKTLEQRVGQLKEIGPHDKALARIEEFVKMDSILFGAVRAMHEL